MATINTLLQKGWQLHQSGQIDAARRYYEHVLSEVPQNPEALVYLGIALFDQRQFQGSADAYRQAIAQRENFPIAWNNLGNSLRMLGQVDEAESCFETSLKQDSTYLSALKNRGTLWVWTGEIQRGLDWYQRGLEVDPNNAELHRNIGVINLLLGNYDVGWEEYRWRWKMAGLFRPEVSSPIWQGESLQGKSILLYPEQGLGDTIQFVRMASALCDRGARVLLMCSERMLPLFTSAPGVDQLVIDSASPPAVDYHASLIEVVDVLYQQTGEIEHGDELWEHGRGYLTVSNELIDYWKRWLDANAGPFRVGINWQGNPEHHADVYRSVPLETLRPLATSDGIELVNLQFGYGSEQLEQVDFGDSILRLPEHVDTDGGAFTDTAAILQNLDCVVTTDTAVAHLAGAVGAKVIMMLGRVPDWRWLMDNETTRWYPSMKLVRQQELGDWNPVAERVRATLLADIGND